MSVLGAVREEAPAEGWERSMGFLLHDVARLLRKRFEQHARAKHLGLTRSQASVLGRLSRQEGINQVTLAQQLELEPITLVRLLDRLQAAGLIERRPDPLDRRARALYLTPQARPLLDRVSVLARDVYDEALAGLSAPERERLVTALELMKGNLLDRLGCAAGSAETEEAAHG
jgi:MarR family transcriptional regulator, transcriptional regulator for hemolysin